MQTNKLSVRATVALSVAAVSFFLLLCFAGYGKAEATRAAAPSAFSDVVARWPITLFGAGAWVAAILGLAWGVVVYFQERTPDLVLRGLGTGVLAASTAMLVGLGGGKVWAGEVGGAAAGAMTKFGGFGTALGWLVGVSLFCVSAIFATDWFFHTLRRGARKPFDPRDLPVEPRSSELLEETAVPAAPEPRQFVRAEAPDVVIPTQEPVGLMGVGRPMPEGWSAEDDGARTVVRAPQGYRGVEFLPASENLAVPEQEEQPETSQFVETAFEGTVRDFAGLVDDEVDFSGEISEPAEESGPVPAPAAAVHAAPVEPEERASGIGFADDVYFVDDVVPVTHASITHASITHASIDVPSYRSPGMAPHDGASAADEIVSAYSETPVAAEPAPTPRNVPSDADAAETEPGFVEEEFVSFSGGFLDDEIVVEGDGPEPIEEASAPPPARASALDEVSASVSPAAVAVLAEPARSSPVAAAPVAAVEPWDFPQVSHDLVEDGIEIPAVAAAEAPAVEMDIADARATFEAVLAEITPLVEASVEAALAPLEAATAKSPVASPAPEAPAVVEAPAAAVEQNVLDTPAPEDGQLGLFPAVACDLSKLHAMELDPLFHPAAEAILAKGRASAVALQRALGVGYARALRLLDQMTEAGMLGPDAPGGAREIHFTKAQWDVFAAQA